jgi:hypothetical protein
MFAFARYIIRHKVGATAVVALGVFFMTPGQGEEAPKSNNPWALDAAPAAASAAGEPGMIDGMIDSTVAFLDENGVNPLSAGDETVGRLEDTASAMGDANSRN